jgi:KDO2-lipid IV(A) lauroyltransferase
MARPRSIAFDYLVYLAVRLVVCVIQSLSFDLACRLADGLAWVIYHANRRHRLVADDNICHAFPGQFNESERDTLIRQVYRHCCTLMVEMAFLTRLVHPTNWSRTMTLFGGRQLADALLSGRPVLLLTGHFGNWEVGNFLLGLFGWKTKAIARALDNPYVDRWLRRFRQHTGQTILDKNQDWEKICQVLANRGALGTLGDQDAGQRGLYVEFFHRPASTHKAVALLALEYQALLLVIGVPREGPRLHFNVYCEDMIDPREYGGRSDAVTAITARFTKALERLIGRNPEQYFWLHRRWKHQPQARVKKAA